MNKKVNNKKASIYVDGGCLYKEIENETTVGDCGWAYLIIGGDDVIFSKKSGYLSKKTHGYAELYAIKEALRFISNLIANPNNTYQYFDFFCDSRTTVDGLNTYMHHWAKSKWRGISNPSLWKEVYTLYYPLKHKLNIIWIESHSDNKYNDMVDDMASQEMYKNSSTIANTSIKGNAIDFIKYIDKEVTIKVGSKEKVGKIFSINILKNTIGMVYENGFEFIFYLENGNVSIKK